MIDGVLAYRYVYGKVVSEAGGPVRLGDGYRITSVSRDMPACLRLLCRPGDLLDNRSTQALVHPERERDGALFFHPACCDGQRWMIASCVRPRPEAGEGTMSRTFTLLVAFVFAADDWARWAPRLLANAPRWLKAEPDTLDFVERGDFPQVRITSEQLPLDPEQRPGDPARPLPLTRNPLFWHIADALENPEGLKQASANVLVGAADRIGSLPAFMQALGFSAALLPPEVRIYVTAAAGLAAAERVFAVQYQPNAPHIANKPGFFAYTAGVRRSQRPDIDLAGWQAYWQRKHPDDPRLDEVWPRLTDRDAWESATEARRLIAKCIDQLVAERSVTELHAWLRGQRPERPEPPQRYQGVTAVGCVRVLVECLNNCAAGADGGRAAAAARAVDLFTTLVQQGGADHQRGRPSWFWAEAWRNAAERAAEHRDVLRWSVLSAAPFPSEKDATPKRDQLGVLQDFSELRVICETLERARAVSPEAAEQVKAATSTRAFNNRLAALRSRAEPILVHNPFSLIDLASSKWLLAPVLGRDLGEDETLRTAVQAIHLACLLYRWTDKPEPARHAELLQAAEVVDKVLAEPSQSLDEEQLRQEFEEGTRECLNDFLLRFFRWALNLEAGGSDGAPTLWRDAVSMTMLRVKRQSGCVECVWLLLTELDDRARTAKSLQASVAASPEQGARFRKEAKKLLGACFDSLVQGLPDNAEVAVFLLESPRAVRALAPQADCNPIADQSAEEWHRRVVAALASEEYDPEQLADGVLPALERRIDELRTNGGQGGQGWAPPPALALRLLRIGHALLSALLRMSVQMPEEPTIRLFERLEWLNQATKGQGQSDQRQLDQRKLRDMLEQLSVDLACCLMRWPGDTPPRPWLLENPGEVTKASIRGLLAERLAYPRCLYFGSVTPAAYALLPCEGALSQRRSAEGIARDPLAAGRLLSEQMRATGSWSNAEAQDRIGRVVAVGALRTWRALFGKGPGGAVGLARLMEDQSAVEVVEAMLRLVREEPLGYQELFDEEAWYTFAFLNGGHGEGSPHLSLPMPESLHDALLASGDREVDSFAITLAGGLLAGPAADSTGVLKLMGHKTPHSRFTGDVLGLRSGWDDFASLGDAEQQACIARLLFMLAMVRSAGARRDARRQRFWFQPSQLTGMLRLATNTAAGQSLARFFDQQSREAAALRQALGDAGLIALPGWPDAVQPRPGSAGISRRNVKR